MNAAHYRRLIDYSYWAHRRVWDCLMQLSDEQFTRPSDYSIGSLHAQVVHTMSSEDLWLRRLRNEAPKPAFESPDAYPTRAAIRARWDEVEAEWRAFGETLTDDLLEQTFTFRSITEDKLKTQFIWEGVTQILNHATDHRAQILALIHQVGGATLEQDFIFYVWGLD